MTPTPQQAAAELLPYIVKSVMDKFEIDKMTNDPNWDGQTMTEEEANKMAEEIQRRLLISE